MRQIKARGLGGQDKHSRHSETQLQNQILDSGLDLLNSKVDLDSVVPDVLDLFGSNDLPEFLKSRENYLKQFLQENSIKYHSGVFPGNTNIKIKKRVPEGAGGETGGSQAKNKTLQVPKIFKKLRKVVNQNPLFNKLKKKANVVDRLAGGSYASTRRNSPKISSRVGDSSGSKNSKNLLQRHLTQVPGHADSTSMADMGLKMSISGSARKIARESGLSSFESISVNTGKGRDQRQTESKSRRALFPKIDVKTTKFKIGENVSELQRGAPEGHLVSSNRGRGRLGTGVLEDFEKLAGIYTEENLMQTKGFFYKRDNKKK